MKNGRQEKSDTKGNLLVTANLQMMHGSEKGYLGGCVRLVERMGTAQYYKNAGRLSELVVVRYLPYTQY